jgi:hypothetical protein
LPSTDWCEIDRYTKHRCIPVRWIDLDDFQHFECGLSDSYTRGLVVDVFGNKWIATPSGLAVYSSAGVTDVDDQMSSSMPQTLQRAQNYPNPFNPTTTVGYTVGAVSLPAGQAGGQRTAESRVRLAVYDLLGREVAVLVDGMMPAGEHNVTFYGANLPTGAYVYRLATESGVLAKKMILLG